jgi:YD repeat-containing protein
MAYDTAGRLASITYPSGNIVSMQYDADGQIKALSQGAQSLISNILYRPYGPPQSWHQGNGANFTRSFDLDGRITQTGMGNVATMGLAYDAANRVTAISETEQSNQSFGYDSLDRLTGFVNGADQTSYSYDANGNRLALADSNPANGATYSIDAASNRLLSGTGNAATPSAFTYDASGNMLSDGERNRGNRLARRSACGHGRRKRPALHPLRPSRLPAHHHRQREPRALDMGACSFRRYAAGCFQAPSAVCPPGMAAKCHPRTFVSQTSVYPA